MPDDDPYTLGDDLCRYDEAMAADDDDDGKTAADCATRFIGPLDYTSDPLAVIELVRLARNGTALACAQAARRWLADSLVEGITLRSIGPVSEQIHQERADRLFRAVLVAGSSPDLRSDDTKAL